MANLSDPLFRHARESGQKCALICEERSFSFAEVAEQVRRIAGGLAEAGVGIGSRVGLMMNSKPEFIFFHQSILALGAVISPLNIFYRKNELAYAVSSCDLEFLIIDRDFADRLPDAADMQSLKHVFVLGLLPDHQTERLRSADAIGLSTRPIDPPVSIPNDSIGLMLNTSATTGKAKGVMLSITNIQANYDPTPQWIGVDRDAVILCALPLYNTFGLNHCINASLVLGATLVIVPRFDAELCLAAIEKYRCTFFPAVPTMLQKLLEHPDSSRRDLSSMNCIFTGGAPVPAVLLERIHAAMGDKTNVITGYGLTEATALVSFGHVRLDSEGKIVRPKSIGRAAPGIKVRLLGETGEEVASGAVGEICVSGPNVMVGYYKNPEETAKAVVDGWLRTGDLGMSDDEGYLYIVDRKKDIIIRGGQNIYPADIEEVIYRHPGVSEVAVIGAANETLGEVPVAYVALKAGQTCRSEDIIARCKDELAYYKVPVAIHFLPELPKGPTGKVLRRGLKPQ